MGTGKAVKIDAFTSLIATRRAAWPFETPCSTWGSATPCSLLWCHPFFWIYPEEPHRKKHQRMLWDLQDRRTSWDSLSNVARSKHAVSFIQWFLLFEHFIHIYIYLPHYLHWDHQQLISLPPSPFFIIVIFNVSLSPIGADHTGGVPLAGTWTTYPQTQPQSCSPSPSSQQQPATPQLRWGLRRPASIPTLWINPQRVTCMYFDRTQSLLLLYNTPTMMTNLSLSQNLQVETSRTGLSSYKSKTKEQYVKHYDISKESMWFLKFSIGSYTVLCLWVRQTHRSRTEEARQTSHSCFLWRGV